MDTQYIAAGLEGSFGGERTFSEDISSGPALRDTLETIIDIVWESIERTQARGRTVTLKMKYTDFQITTRAKSLAAPVPDKATFAGIARTLLDESLPLPLPIRLMGLTLSNLDRGDVAQEKPRNDPQLSLL